jgi:hypothetical protein
MFQIQEFLTVAKTGMPVARQKRWTEPDDDLPEERPSKRKRHPTSLLDMTEDTPRTLISNILNSSLYQSSINLGPFCFIILIIFNSDENVKIILKLFFPILLTI